MTSRFHPAAWRRACSAFSLAIPLVITLLARCAWGADIPATIGTHWSGPGGADGASAEAAVFAGSLAVLIVVLMVGCVIVAVPALSATARRGALLVLGSLSGGAATQWLIPTHLTMVAGQWGEAVLGGWILVHFASWCYGLVPMLIAPSSTSRRPSVSPQSSPPVG